MPISLYEGAPGGGKSYHAVKTLRDAVDSGRVVWTNIEGLQVHKFSNPALIHMMTDAQVQRPWLYLPKNSLCIIDEALMPFPDDFGKNEDTTQADVVDLKKWATQHRHDGQDIIMVVQDSWMLARVLRNVAAVRVNYHNQGHLGFGKRCRIKYFSPCKERRPYKTSNVKYDKNVFPLYQSVKEGSDLAATKGKNILLSPFVIIPVLGLAVAFWATGGLFSRYNDAATPQIKAVIKTPALVSEAISLKSNVNHAVSGKKNIIENKTQLDEKKYTAWVSGFSFLQERVFVFLSSKDKQSLASDVGLIFSRSGDDISLNGQVFHIGQSVQLTKIQFSKLARVDTLLSSIPGKKQILIGDSTKARYESFISQKQILNPLKQFFPAKSPDNVKSYTHGADGWVDNGNI